MRKRKLQEHTVWLDFGVASQSLESSNEVNSLRVIHGIPAWFSLPRC